jgi:hypothetical protein
MEKVKIVGGEEYAFREVRGSSHRSNVSRYSST